MKYLIVSVLLCLFVSTQLYSQKFEYGFGGGVNYQNVIYYSGHEIVPRFYKIGGVLNAIIERNFNNKIGFRIEPGLYDKGFLYDGSGTMIVEKTRVDNYFIGIPLLFKYSPVKRLNIVIGSEIEYLISTSGLAIDGWYWRKWNEEDLSGYKFNFGLNGGLIYKTSKGFECSLRFNRTLLIKKEYYYNQGFAFTVSYIINREKNNTNKDKIN